MSLCIKGTHVWGWVTRVVTLLRPLKNVLVINPPVCLSGLRGITKGIALHREKARWVWMGLAGPLVAEVRTFWKWLRGIK